MTALHRVLVVEDHEPFRRALCGLLRQRPDVQIVGEADDGIDAIRQAEALRPDVVMLDIGLPTVSGIEVGDRIRASMPDARLMFVTNESSLDIVEHVYKRGAHGFVYKPRAQRDVLRVFESIVRGSRFVSGGLERVERGDSLASHRHHALFYSDDATLFSVFIRFVGEALDAGKAVTILLSEHHERVLRQRLELSYAGFDRALREKRYIPVSIREVVTSVMVDGSPDPGRFEAAAEDLVTIAAQCATNGKVAAAGDCSSTIWAEGHVGAALQFEHLWDQVAQRYEIDTLCAYPLIARNESQRIVRNLCAEHTEVEIS